MNPSQTPSLIELFSLGDWVYCNALWRSDQAKWHTVFNYCTVGLKTVLWKLHVPSTQQKSGKNKIRNRASDIHCTLQHKDICVQLGMRLTFLCSPNGCFFPTGTDLCNLGIYCNSGRCSAITWSLVTLGEGISFILPLVIERKIRYGCPTTFNDLC